MTQEKPCSEERSHFPSGLTERSGSPEPTQVLDDIEKALRAFDYEGAVKIAATQNMGMKAQIRAIADLHRIEAINAHRDGNEEVMALAITRRRLALAAIGLPCEDDPIAEYQERLQKNGHSPLPLYEGKK